MKILRDSEGGGPSVVWGFLGRLEVVRWSGGRVKVLGSTVTLGEKVLAVDSTAFNSHYNKSEFFSGCLSIRVQ